MTFYAGVQQLVYHNFWVMTDHRRYESVSYCLKNKFHPVIFTETSYTEKCKIMGADQRRDDRTERKEGQVLQIVLTLSHAAAKKKTKRHKIKSTTHEIMEKAFQLYEKLISSILGQEAIRL